MSSKKFATAVLAGVTALSVLVAGCTGAKKEPEAPAAGGGAKEPVTLRVGTWESFKGTGVWQEIIEAFEKQNQGIKISLESVPDNYGTKLLTQIATGDAPDVFQIGDGDVRMFTEKGALEDLTPYVDGNDGLKRDTFYENVLGVGIVDGKVRTLPKDFSNLAVYYNKDLFQAANVAEPKAGWTWADFEDAAKKLTKVEGGKTTQFGVDLPGTWQRAILPFIYQAGGDVISPDGKTHVGYLDSDKTVKALDFYLGLYAAKVAPTPTDKSTTFQGVDLFASGKAAMSITGRWPLANYKETKGLNFGVAPLPKGEKEANTICYAGFGMYSKSEHKDEAWKFLKFLSTTEGAAILAKHAIPAVKAEAEKAYGDDPHMKVFMDTMKDINPNFPEKISQHFGASGAKNWNDLLEQVLVKGEQVDLKKALGEKAIQADKDLAEAKKQ